MDTNPVMEQGGMPNSSAHTPLLVGDGVDSGGRTPPPAFLLDIHDDAGVSVLGR